MAEQQVAGGKTAPRRRARRSPTPLLVEEQPREGGGGTRQVVTAAGCETARRMLSEGCPEALVASVLGVARRTLRDCRDRQPELADAWAAGLGELESELVSLLIESARKGHYASAMFLLKTKCGYREQGPVDGGADNRVQVNIALPDPRSREDYMRLVSGAPTHAQ